MIWYCDSSALVKRYVRETGSRWFREEVSQHRLLTSTLAVAEVPAAFSRRKRDGTLSIFEFHRSRIHFTRHLQTGQYSLLSPTLEIIEQSALLIYRLPLAGYDAVHLATALFAVRNVDRDQFCFLTSDQQLRRAAEAEGLTTKNPNDHL